MLLVLLLPFILDAAAEAMFVQKKNLFTTAGKSGEACL